MAKKAMAASKPVVAKKPSPAPVQGEDEQAKQQAPTQVAAHKCTSAHMLATNPSADAEAALLIASPFSKRGRSAASCSRCGHVGQARSRCPNVLGE